MKIIGLTGGIASGKSTVSNYIKEKGFKIVDADIIARRVVMPDTEGLKKLIDYFGLEILDEFAALDRKKLARIVFSDKEKLDALNNLLHPLIRIEILKEFDEHKVNGENIIIFDCPLLFEGNYESMCDETWLVSISLETQLKRLTLRDNIDNVHAKKIIDSQMPIDEKAKIADIIINNEKEIDDLYKKIDELLLK